MSEFAGSTIANFRNFSDAANHAENARTGVAAATATAIPRRFASFLNQSRSDAIKANANQATTRPAENFPLLFTVGLHNESPCLVTRSVT